MLSGLGPATATAIDGLANRLCTPSATSGELRQLRRLFTPAFIQGLERILRTATGTRPPGPRSPHIEVSLGWIDKIPLAESGLLGGSGSKLERTELGDAIVVIVDQQLHAAGAPVITDARAVFLQAKIAWSLKQILSPVVPVGARSPSMRKELALLSSWPTFDLFKASRSRTVRLKGVSLPVGPPERFGWYIAAPKGPLTAGSGAAWRSWWMAGSPAPGAACDVSLGELLVGLLEGSAAGGRPVGEAFDYGPVSPGRSHWSLLCNEVLAILGEDDAPEWVFGPGKSRLASLTLRAAVYAAGLRHRLPQQDLAEMDEILSHFVAHRLPVPPVWLVQRFASIGSPAPPDWSGLMKLLWRHLTAAWEDGRRRNARAKFAVLQVTVTRPPEGLD